MFFQLLFIISISIQESIWIDTDSGNSQMLSIIYGFYNLKIIGISTIYGKNSAQQAGVNVLKITTNLMLPYRASVIQGHDLPINKHPCIQFNNNNGLYMAQAFQDHQIPIYNPNFTDELNVQTEYLSKNKNYTLIMLGAITNFAKLFQQYPERITQIKEIVLVGGDYDKCDFNYNCDSEALELLLEIAQAHQILVTLIPESVTPKEIPQKVKDDLKTSNKSLVKWILGMFEEEDFNFHKRSFSNYINQVLGTYYVAHKEQFKIEQFGLEILKTQDCQAYLQFYKENQWIRVTTEFQIGKFWSSVVSTIVKASKGAIINI